MVVFCAPRSFRVLSPYGTCRQTDGRTDGRTGKPQDPYFGLLCRTPLLRFVVYLLYNKLYTTNPQRIESQQQVHNKLHATISKSYSKSHNLLYNKLSTANRSNRVRDISTAAQQYYIVKPLTTAHYWRQVVELTARRHHHCNISVDFSAQTENFFISSII